MSDSHIHYPWPFKQFRHAVKPGSLPEGRGQEAGDTLDEMRFQVISYYYRIIICKTPL